MNQNQVYQEARAIRTLQEISNQDTNYQWGPIKSRKNNITEFIKRKATLDQSSKLLKLPTIVSKRNNEQNSSRLLVRYKSSAKQKPTCFRNFFNHTPSTGLIKYQSLQAYKENNNEDSEKKQCEFDIVKSWLTQKRIQSKSLNIIINKFRDDSGKHQSKQHLLPFTIKSLT